MKFETSLKLIQAMIAEPFREYNINQLSNLSGISLATTYRTLKQMEKLKMLLKRENGIEKLYRLNLQNSFTRKFLEAISISQRRKFFTQNPKYFGILSKLKQKLKGLVELILLDFNNEKLELFVLSDKIQNKNLNLRENISLTFLTEAELKKTLKQNKNLIVLYGESKFWDLVSQLTNGLIL